MLALELCDLGLERVGVLDRLVVQLLQLTEAENSDTNGGHRVVDQPNLLGLGVFGLLQQLVLLLLRRGEVLLVLAQLVRVLLLQLLLR